MQFSTYQDSIFSAVVKTKGNLAVSAVAGSGKTTTLVEVYNRLPRGKKVVFLAFGKTTAKMLESRLPGCDCRTIHSLGYGAIRQQYPNMRVDEHKIVDLVDKWLQDTAPQWLPTKFWGNFAGLITKVVNMARLTLTDLRNEQATDDMLRHFGIWGEIDELSDEGDLNFNLIADRLIFAAKDVLKVSNQKFERWGIIDYTDMTYLPVQYNLTVKKYDYVLVDEAQDLNKAQLELVMRAAGTKGRMIAVGDPRQAIMGFAGASSDSFAKIVERSRATVLPLSICYRCPKSHVALAKDIVPSIEAGPTAQEGTIETLTYAQFLGKPQRGDLIICRTNAPLVGPVLRLISSGIQARIRGRDVAKGLVKIITEADRKIAGDPARAALGFVEDFGYKLGMYVDHRIDVLRTKPHSEAQQETLLDQKECITAFMEGRPGVTSADQLARELQDLFADEDAAIWASSFHRAKGLEAMAVYIINPDKMTLSYKGMLAWQLEQEENVKYVALTRSKQALYFVEGKNAPEPEATQPALVEAPEEDLITA